jgi:chromosome segregation ATPase
VRALLRGAGANVCEVVVVNDELARKPLEEYAESRAERATYVRLNKPAPAPAATT